MAEGRDNAARRRPQHVTQEPSRRAAQAPIRAQAQLGASTSGRALTGAWMGGLGAVVQLDHAQRLAGLPPERCALTSSNTDRLALMHAAMAMDAALGAPEGDAGVAEAERGVVGPPQVDVEAVMRLASAQAGGALPLAVARRVQAALTGGQPLPEPTRLRMEQALGHDFSHVRVHTDARARRAARDVQAVAFTADAHIVFGDGAYAPGTEAGDRVLLHELTHVVQEDAGRISRAEGWSVSSPTDPLEREAARAEQLSPTLPDGGSAASPLEPALGVTSGPEVAGGEATSAPSGSHEGPLYTTPQPQGPGATQGNSAGQGQSEDTCDTGEQDGHGEGSKVAKTSREAPVLLEGVDDNKVAEFTPEQVDAKQYPFRPKSNIPKGSEVEITAEDTSLDGSKRVRKQVAEVKVLSVPEGQDQSHVGQTYWTTRSNVSESPNDDGHHTIIASQTTIRDAPKTLQVPRTIPKGTEVEVFDAKGIEDFPKATRLENNAARDSFHANRYMRLFLRVRWQDEGCATHEGWISADDVEGDFANEKIGTSEVPEGSLESDDPAHVTVGTATAPHHKKDGFAFEVRYEGGAPKKGDPVKIPKGAIVELHEVSDDGAHAKVSVVDGELTQVWIEVKGNVNLKAPEPAAEGAEEESQRYKLLGVAYVRDRKPNFVPIKGAAFKRGDYLEIFAEEGEMVEVCEVKREGEQRIKQEQHVWVQRARLAPGWSEDLKGAHASWGMEQVGTELLTKYKGQTALVNIGGTGGKMKQMSKEAYDNVMTMISDAKTEGVTITLNSGFRTFFSQKYFKDNENKPGFNAAATPGNSGHQDSRAFDLNNLQDAAVYDWLRKNAWRYGIVQNVHANNERHHWAYMPEVAKEGVYTTWGTPSGQAW